MISASKALYNYFNQNIREEGQEIEIKIFKSGTTYTITDGDLVSSSVKITKKSVSGASFDIGECYVDNVTFTINKNINNYRSLTGAKVTVRIKVNNTDLNISESVLLGTFRIPQDGIKRTNTLLQVTADSYISKFDKSRKRATFTGDLYDLVSDSCSKCKVTFGMSESAFRSLSANVAKTYEIKKDSSLKTHRDVIMYVAQLIGGFATTTPAGELIFKNYTSKNDTCNVNDNVIINYSIGDEVYNLSGLGMSVKENDVYLYREGEDDDSPYFLNLDTNPIIENSTDKEITSIVGNIWTKLIELNLNNFSFEFNGNPLIEVGDIISIPERSLETYVASFEWTYHGKEKISCVSVDKNKRTESQKDKQNENKPSSSKDDRVDDLIKKTTTKTRKVKKTITEPNIVTNYVSQETINYADSDISIMTEQKQLSYTLSTGATQTFQVSSVDLTLIFYYPAIGLNISDIIDKLPNTTKDSDIITLNFKDTKGFVFLGYTGINPSTRERIFFNIKPYTGSKTYSIKDYDGTQILSNASMSVNYFDSLSDAILYETDAFGNFTSEIPNFNVSTSGTTVVTDVGSHSSTTREYGINASFNFNFQNVLDANNINYESIENNVLAIKYKDLKYIKNSLNGKLLDTTKFDGSTAFYNSLITYADTYYRRTKSDTLDSFNNTISKGGILFSYCAIEQNEDTQTKYDNYTYSDNFIIDVTYKEETEESYTTTIEGTSDKINENTDKTDENADEIEKLKASVEKNKTNITKLKQKVTSVTNKVGTMSNSLGVAKTDIAKLDVRVTKLENSGGGSGGGMTDAQKKQLEQNTKDISTLKTNVSNNTKNINTNTTNITELTTRVTNLEKGGSSSGGGATEEEKQQIEQNKKDISSLNTKVTDLTTRVTDLENAGSSGSGITAAERQQIQTNKTNIDSLTTVVSGHTTSIEDILKRLTALEQGGGGETGDAFKFKAFNLALLAKDNNFSNTFPSLDIKNYYFNDTYYISNDGGLYFRTQAELTKTNTKQTFRYFYRTDGTQYYISGTADTENLESDKLRFTSTNAYEYLDCISKFDDQQIISPTIPVYIYRKLSVTTNTSNWSNETTGNTIKTDGGAHVGDTLSIPITFNYGFKAVTAENKPDKLNKYYYMINSTYKNANVSGDIVDWTEINAEPNVATTINFIYNDAASKSQYVNLYVSDGQYAFRQTNLYIKKLT